MNLLPALQQLLPLDARKVLLIGPVPQEVAAWLSEAPQREIWTVQSCRTGGPALGRTITGRLLTLGPGTLAPRSFDLVAAFGDLPFGSELDPFLRRVTKLLSPSGRVLLRVRNPLRSDILARRLSGGFDLDNSGSFTPTEAQCALAALGMKVIGQWTEVMEGGPDDVTGINEVAMAAVPIAPLIDPKHSLPDGDGQTLASIVVLTYNSATTIEACLTSVLAPLSPDDEVTVVDNASQDDTVSVVESLASGDARMRLLRNETNLGFSAGSNVGILASRGAFVLLLNPDTVVWPGWVENLTTPFVDPSVGMVGPLSDRIAGQQFVGQYVSPKEGPVAPEQLAEFCAREFAGQFLGTKLLIGMCVALRRATLQAVGLLDESLFLGSDDLELSWRLRTHDMKLLVSKQTFVQHLGGVSFSSLQSDEKSKLLYDSTETLLAKIRDYYGWNPPDEFLWGIRITHQ